MVAGADIPAQTLSVGAALIGVVVAAAMLGLSVAGDLRDEIRTVRTEVEAIRAEARADREVFQKQILRLTEGQGLLYGLIEGLREERRESGEAPAE